MKTENYCTILFALVLAAILIVPIVTAESEDVKDLILPQFTVDESQEKTIIDKELSPVKDENLYHIPEGSVIYHSMGMTRVFDSRGMQLLVSDDSTSKLISTPNGPMPASHVHEVPSGAVISEKKGFSVVKY
ncbi:MAG: hypothetical protein GYA23_01425 [Methanomicrobiales archaeon]|nr:hypothetical protein [Methanomicrobiales archaeon]